MNSAFALHDKEGDGMKVIVYQEDKNVGKRICAFLQDNGYKASALAAVEEMYASVSDTMPDIIITDIPGMSEAARISGQLLIPFVVVSSVTSEKVKVRALDGGAEDYIVRPFMKEEFLARLRVVMRRMGGARKYSAPGLEIDFEKHYIKRDGEEIKLTPVEYKIVELLCRQPGSVLTHEYLLKQIWGPYVRGDNKILRVNITNIRKKLESDPANPVYIKTENGIGYRMSYNNSGRQS